MFGKLCIALLFFHVSLSACNGQSGAAEKASPVNASQTPSAVSAKSAALNSERSSEAGLASSSSGALDACMLIEKSEIAGVQGVPVEQAQATNQRNGELDISQCYYTALRGKENLSVFVQVIQRDARSMRRDVLKEFWVERLERESRQDKERAEEKERAEQTERVRAEEEEEEMGEPQPVSGIGDKAVWLGTSRGGALYVRKGHKVIRVTIGGVGSPNLSLEKSKTVAKKALARLK